MKVLRRVMIFGLIWFFCLSFQEGWAEEVRTYTPYGEPGETFTIRDRQCVDYVKENRTDLGDVSYGNANGMLSVLSAKGSGFTVDEKPEKGAVIYFKYEDSGHVGIVDRVEDMGNKKYKLTIMDNNFDRNIKDDEGNFVAGIIGKADYTYNSKTGRIEILDYTAHNSPTYQGKKYIVTDPKKTNYSDVEFIHENKPIVNKVVSAFNKHQIEPSADQLGLLSQKLLKGEDIEGYFDSKKIENAYYTFPNYGSGKYLHSGSGGVKKWEVLLKKLEISTDSSNWVVLGEGDVKLDIALADATKTILANYATNPNVPQGIYRYYRLTLGAEYTVKGQATDPITGYTYYTTSDFKQSSQPKDDSKTGKSKSSRRDTEPAEPSECSLKVNTYSTDPGFWASPGSNNFTWTQPFPQPFEVKGGTRKIILTFNIGTGIVFVPNGWGYDGTMFDIGGDLLPEVEVQ